MHDCKYLNKRTYRPSYGTGNWQAAEKFCSWCIIHRICLSLRESLTPTVLVATLPNSPLRSAGERETNADKCTAKLKRRHFYPPSAWRVHLCMCGRSFHWGRATWNASKKGRGAQRSDGKGLTDMSWHGKQFYWRQHKRKYKIKHVIWCTHRPKTETINMI